MASCQEDQIPAPSAESDANSAPEAVVEVVITIVKFMYN